MIESARIMLQRASRIVSFSGAGLSAESGVPTFRDAATGGLWSNYDPMKLASPEGFAADPELVLRWYSDRRRGVATAHPNPAHRSLAARGDITNITQNVDDLLERAGARAVIHLHGEINADRCHALCGYSVPIDPLNPPARTYCPHCRAPMRPAVVWFGEALPTDVWARAESAAAACDVMLVIGTGAEVYPAAGLIGLARRADARIIIVNTQPSAASRVADIELLGRAGEIVPKLLGEYVSQAV